LAVSRSFKLDTGAVTKLLHGRTGDVGRVMAGFAGIATEEVRKVSDERIKHRTGRYRRSIRSQVAAGNRVEVHASAPYSIFLERGTRPHIIVPRRPGGVLVFKVGGKTIFTRLVHHPGTRPYNILRDGVARAGRKLNRLAKR
jgi:hypothetical protein